jgi:hypothetical protein
MTSNIARLRRATDKLFETVTNLATTISDVLDAHRMDANQVLLMFELHRTKVDFLRTDRVRKYILANDRAMLLDSIEAAVFDLMADVQHDTDDAVERSEALEECTRGMRLLLRDIASHTESAPRRSGNRQEEEEEEDEEEEEEEQEETEDELDQKHRAAVETYVRNRLAGTGSAEEDEMNASIALLQRLCK